MWACCGVVARCGVQSRSRKKKHTKMFKQTGFPKRNFELVAGNVSRTSLDCPCFSVKNKNTQTGFCAEKMFEKPVCLKICVFFPVNVKCACWWLDGGGGDVCVGGGRGGGGVG